MITLLNVAGLREMITTEMTSPTGMATDGLTLHQIETLTTEITMGIMITAVLRGEIITMEILIHRFASLIQEGRIITGRSDSHSKWREGRSHRNVNHNNR